MARPESKSIVYLTAGAGGMYCGSCMHDNLLARALLGIGHDVQLVPTYTPLRTDEEDVSIDQLFFGGVNLYLRQKLGRWGNWPRVLSKWLDSPRLVRWLTGKAISIQPDQLGALTLSMLQGAEGRHKAEVDRLVHWMRDHAQPDCILFSNLLIGGSLPTIRETIDAPIFVLLQGDDLFLDALPEPYRSQAIEQMRMLAKKVDRFLLHSQFYAERMAALLAVPLDSFLQIPLGIDSEPFVRKENASVSARPPTIGYLARIAPEKGLDLLVDALIKLRQREGLGKTELHVAGWMSNEHRPYLETQQVKLTQAGCGEAMRYIGAIDRQEKIDFLATLDLFSVPTSLPDPKGIYILESLAAGVPVVQPSHGSFPELLAATGGGLLFPPHDASQLAEKLALLLQDTSLRQRLGREGQAAVKEKCAPEKVAQATWAKIEPLIG